MDELQQININILLWHISRNFLSQLFYYANKIITWIILCVEYKLNKKWNEFHKGKIVFKSDIIILYLLLSPLYIAQIFNSYEYHEDIIY